MTKNAREDVTCPRTQTNLTFEKSDGKRTTNLEFLEKSSSLLDERKSRKKNETKSWSFVCDARRQKNGLGEKETNQGHPLMNGMPTGTRF